jgi:hypothetical protein
MVKDMTKKLTTYCKPIDIWERINSKKITIYRCFQSIPDNKYFVQTKDYYYMDSETSLIDKEQISYLNYQHLAHILESARK